MHRTCSLLLLFTFVTFIYGAEDKVPAHSIEPESASTAPQYPGAKLTEKMKSIILPAVDFHGVTLEAALEYLRKQSRALDKSSGPPETKGVQIILRPRRDQDEASIHLNLKNVTLFDALLQITDVKQMLFKVEAQAVIVSDPHAYQSERHTRLFKVPSDFLSYGTPKPGAPPAPTDPFAVPQPEPEKGKIPRRSAKQILESVGITFPEQASAVFSPATRLLKVTNTLPNLDLVEAFFDSVCHLPPFSISTTLTVVEGPGDLIRQINADASRRPDVTNEFARLLKLAKAPNSNVHIIADAFLKGKVGQISSTSVTCEPVQIQGVNLEGTPFTTKDVPSPGLTFESESTLSGYGTPIHTHFRVKFQLPLVKARETSSGTPQVRQESEAPSPLFDRAEFTSSIVSVSGATKLVGLAKPNGPTDANPEILWAAFLTCTVHPVQALSPASTSVGSRTSEPSGMTTVTLRSPPGLLEFLMDPPQQPLREWLEKDQGIAFPPGAVLEQQGSDLHLINTPESIEAIGALITLAESVVPNDVAFTLHTIEAPAALLRDLSHQSTTAGADDTAMFTAVNAAVTRGEARFIDSIFYPARSGSHSTVESAREFTFLSELGSNEKKQSTISFATRPIGSILRIDPSIGSDGRTVDIKFSHELYPAAPETREGQLADSVSGQSCHTPISFLHTLKTSGEVTLTKGGTQLIALQQPTGRDTQGQLWATFLKCDVVPQLIVPAPPKGNRTRKSSDPDLMETKAYHVPPDFSTRAYQPIDPPASDAEPAGTDPFAVDSTPSTPPGSQHVHAMRDLRDLLRPEGSSASYNPATSTLVVHNTPANLALVDAWVERLTLAGPTTTVFTTHIFQTTGTLLRRLTAQAADKIDHRAELDEILTAVKAGQAQSLDIARIETEPGSPATSQQGTPDSSVIKALINKEGAPATITQNRNVGLKFHLESSTDSAQQMVEPNITLEFHTAPPFEHREHIIDTQGHRLEFPLTDYFTTKLTTGIIMPSGTARLLSLSKPTGNSDLDKADILQAIFITCDILRAEK